MIIFGYVLCDDFNLSDEFMLHVNYPWYITDIQLHITTRRLLVYKYVIFFILIDSCIV